MTSVTLKGSNPPPMVLFPYPTISRSRSLALSLRSVVLQSALSYKSLSLEQQFGKHFSLQALYFSSTNIKKKKPGGWNRKRMLAGFIQCNLNKVCHLANRVFQC